MHFHLPKPLHGWREFLGEVGIIVVGILLALGAEQLIEQRHWREQAALAKEAIKGDLGEAALVGYERMVIKPCLDARILELAGALQNGGDRWPASPLKFVSPTALNVLPMAYRTPSRPVSSDAWDNALANGTLNHLPPADVAAFSGLFNQVRHWGRLNEEEQAAASRLTPLSFDRRLDERSRADYVAQLAEADRINALITLISGQVIDAVGDLKLGFDKREVAKARQETLNWQRQARGQCVRALPLDLH